jgi:hypothetical protein
VELLEVVDEKIESYAKRARLLELQEGYISQHFTGSGAASHGRSGHLK